MAHVRDAVDGGTGRRLIEGFADLPGLVVTAGVNEEGASGHIEPSAIAEDAIERSRRLDIRSARFQRNHQLDFVLKVFGQRWITHRAGALHDSVAVLGEIIRMTHGRRVVLRRGGHRIIAASAIDTTYRKAQAGSHNRKRYDW